VFGIIQIQESSAEIKLTQYEEEEEEEEGTVLCSVRFGI